MARPGAGRSKDRMLDAWPGEGKRPAGIADEGFGGAVVEGMGQGDGGHDPFESVAGEREGAQEGRGGGEREYGSADVVEEAGESQFSGAQSAAGNRLGFEDRDAPAGAGQRDGGREAVGAGADDVGGWRQTLSRSSRRVTGAVPSFPTAMPLAWLAISAASAASAPAARASVNIAMAVSPAPETS